MDADLPQACKDLEGKVSSNSIIASILEVYMQQPKEVDAVKILTKVEKLNVQQLTGAFMEVNNLFSSNVETKNNVCKALFALALFKGVKFKNKPKLGKKLEERYPEQFKIMEDHEKPEAKSLAISSYRDIKVALNMKSQKTIAKYPNFVTISNFMFKELDGI